MKLLKSYMLIILVTTATVFSMYDEYSVAAGDPDSIPSYEPSPVSLGILALKDVPFDESCIVGPTSGDYSPGAIVGLLKKAARNDVSMSRTSDARGNIVNDLKKILQCLESGAQTNIEEAVSAMNLLAVGKPDVTEVKRSLENVLSVLRTQYFELWCLLRGLNEITTSS